MKLLFVIIIKQNWNTQSNAIIMGFHKCKKYVYTMCMYMYIFYKSYDAKKKIKSNFILLYKNYK